MNHLIKPLIKPMSAAMLAAFAATCAPLALAAGPDLKIALIAGKTGPLEAYAKAVSYTHLRAHET